MSDVLHCRLKNVGGRVYRVYGQAGAHDRRDEQSRWSNQSELRVQHRCGDDEDFAEADDDPSIMTDGPGFLCALDIDSEVLPYIIGSKGRTKQRIEADTGARLIIPRKDSENRAGSSKVTIRADSRRAVARARTQTEVVISQALSSNRLAYNYFLSLPLASSATQQQMEVFKADVLRQEWAAAAGLEESLFMKTAHLHLTLAMLKLYSDSQRQAARQVLHSLAPRVRAIVGEEPLEVQLQGLQYMNDDPSQMHVVYLGVSSPSSQPEALQRLQQLCAAVVGAFAEAGLLLERDDRDVKLHATVLNTRYRQRRTGDAHQVRQPIQRQPIDGRQLLDNFKDVDFGVIRLQSVHLSQRGKYGPDGYYLCDDSLALPAN